MSYQITFKVILVFHLFSFCVNSPTIASHGNNSHSEEAANHGIPAMAEDNTSSGSGDKAALPSTQDSLSKNLLGSMLWFKNSSLLKTFNDSLAVGRCRAYCTERFENGCSGGNCDQCWNKCESIVQQQVDGTCGTDQSSKGSTSACQFFKTWNASGVGKDLSFLSSSLDDFFKTSNRTKANITLEEDEYMKLNMETCGRMEWHLGQANKTNGSYFQDGGQHSSGVAKRHEHSVLLIGAIVDKSGKEEEHKMFDFVELKHTTRKHGEAALDFEVIDQIKATIILELTSNEILTSEIFLPEKQCSSTEIHQEVVEWIPELVSVADGQIIVTWPDRQVNSDSYQFPAKFLLRWDQNNLIGYYLTNESYAVLPLANWNHSLASSTNQVRDKHGSTNQISSGQTLKLQVIKLGTELSSSTLVIDLNKTKTTIKEDHVFRQDGGLSSIILTAVVTSLVSVVIVSGVAAILLIILSGRISSNLTNMRVVEDKIVTTTASVDQDQAPRTTFSCRRLFRSAVERILTKWRMLCGRFASRTALPKDLSCLEHGGQRTEADGDDCARSIATSAADESCPGGRKMVRFESFLAVHNIVMDEAIKPMDG